MNWRAVIPSRVWTRSLTEHMLVTITYILTAGFGGIPMTWWALVITGLTDAAIVSQLKEMYIGEEQSEALDADDLEQ